MEFVHLLGYLIRPYPSKTHRSGELIINTAIMQLATYEIESSRALARKSVSVPTAKCDAATCGLSFPLTDVILRFNKYL